MISTKRFHTRLGILVLGVEIGIKYPARVLITATSMADTGKFILFESSLLSLSR